MDINNVTTGEWMVIASVIFVLYNLIMKFVYPVFQAKYNIERNSAKLAEVDAFERSLNAFREESQRTDRLLVKAMVAMIDNRVSGNNVENLKQIKEDLMRFLTA